MKEQNSNASNENVHSSILEETFHNSNQSQNEIEHKVEVPSSTPHNPQKPYSPTAYDYLALAPTLLVAITPLVLGWLNRRNKDKE